MSLKIFYKTLIKNTKLYRFFFFIESVFGKRMVAIPDGFLVPFKDDGYIYLVDISGSTPQGPYKLTDHTEGKWFYHRVMWKDMDGDGDLDILTCRAREPVFSIFCKMVINDSILL